MEFAERYYIQKINPKYNTMLSDKPISFTLPELDNIKFKDHDINEFTAGKNKKSEKELIAIRIRSDLSDKIKTVCVDHNINRSVLLDELLKTTFENVVIDENAIKEYEKKNKKKSK